VLVRFMRCPFAVNTWFRWQSSTSWLGDRGARPERHDATRPRQRCLRRGL